MKFDFSDRESENLKIISSGATFFGQNVENVLEGRFCLCRRSGLEDPSFFLGKLGVFRRGLGRRN